MELKITSSDELNRLLDVLADDIVDANICYRLQVDILDSAQQYQTEFGHAPTFWYYTIRSLEEAYCSRLCRIFEQHATSLNLYNLLDTIRANLNYFEEAHFRERLKGNAFVDSLAKDAKIPSLQDLQADLEVVSEKNPVVKDLMMWRHNRHAHIGFKVALGKSTALNSVLIGRQQFDHLLDECFRILNKYMYLYKATTWSRQVVGRNDFLSILRFMRLGLEKQKTEVEAQLEAAARSDQSRGIS